MTLALLHYGAVVWVPYVLFAFISSILFFNEKCGNSTAYAITVWMFAWLIDLSSFNLIKIRETIGIENYEQARNSEKYQCFKGN